MLRFRWVFSLTRTTNWKSLVWFLGHHPVSQRDNPDLSKDPGGTLSWMPCCCHVTQPGCMTFSLLHFTWFLFTRSSIFWMAFMNVEIWGIYSNCCLVIKLTCVILGNSWYLSVKTGIAIPSRTQSEYLPKVLSNLEIVSFQWLFFS